MGTRRNFRRVVGGQAQKGPPHGKKKPIRGTKQQKGPHREKGLS